jgi:hypothetical protein
LETNLDVCFWCDHLRDQAQNEVKAIVFQKLVKGRQQWVFIAAQALSQRLNKFQRMLQKHDILNVVLGDFRILGLGHLGENSFHFRKTKQLILFIRLHNHRQTVQPNLNADADEMVEIEELSDDWLK